MLRPLICLPFLINLFRSALALLGTIYVFYSIPLTAAARLVDPQSIKEVFPKLSEWVDVSVLYWI